MPNWKTHFAISKRRTGDSYFKLHKWIDDNKDESGVNHRNKKHAYTEEDREFVESNFDGAEAVSEWLFHIALDNLDTSVTNDWMHKISNSNLHMFGFQGNGYIFYEEDEVGDDELVKEFSNYEEE